MRKSTAGRAAASSPPDNLVYFPGVRMGAYCIPVRLKAREHKAIHVGHARMVKQGIPKGSTVIVTPYGPGETPRPDGELVLAYLKQCRFVRRAKVEASGAVTLSDDYGSSTHDPGRVVITGRVAHVCHGCKEGGPYCPPWQAPTPPRQPKPRPNPTPCRRRLAVWRELDDEYQNFLAELERPDALTELGLVMEADPDNGNPTLAPACAEMFGPEGVALLSLEWLRLIHPDDRDGAITDWLRGHLAGEPYASTFHVLAHGYYVTATWTAEPVRDAAGRVVRWRYYCRLAEADDE